MGWTTEELGSFSGSDKFLSVLHSDQTDSGTRPASYPVCMGALYPGVKKPKREAHNLFPSSVDAKNTLMHSKTPTIP
jgi:hypothetical protein